MASFMDSFKKKVLGQKGDTEPANIGKQSEATKSHAGANPRLSFGEDPCSILRLGELLEVRNPTEPIDKFIRKWSRIAYGMTGALSTIVPDKWPLLKELPNEMKRSAMFANVMTYEVDDHDVPHAFIYTVDKRTFYVGETLYFGKVAEATRPREVKELAGLELVAIHMGPSSVNPFACAHAADGTIYTSGCGKHGNLGHGDSVDLATFRRVDGLSRIIQVTCGGGFCTTLDVDGRISTFGDNEDGQCAMSPPGQEQRYNTPQCISSMKSIKPIFIACGLSHCIVGGGDGQLVSYGSNTVLALGRECDGEWSATPTAISHLEGHRIQKVVCGCNHTLCLTTMGQLLVWGWNGFGQAGVGYAQNVATPVPIACQENRILDVLAVGFTSLAITLDGECLIWGRHDDEDIDKPGIMDTTATPRDLLIKGYLVSTGGCVHLDGSIGVDPTLKQCTDGLLDGNSESMELLRCHLEEAVKQLANVKTAHNVTTENLVDVIRAHEATQQQLADEITAHKGAEQQLDDVKTAHRVTKQQLADVNLALRATKQKLVDVNATHEKTKQQLDDVKTEHEATKQKLVDVNTTCEATKQQLADVNAAHEATKQQLVHVKTAHDANKQQLADVDTVHEATNQRLLDVNMAHEATKKHMPDVNTTNEAIKQQLYTTTQQLADVNMANEAIKQQLAGVNTALVATQQQLFDVKTAHEATKQELGDANMSQGATKKQLADINTAHETTKQQLEATKQRLADVSQTHETTKQQLGVYKDQIRGLNHEVATLKTERKAGIERERTLLDILQRVHTPSQQSPPHQTQGAAGGVAAQPGFHFTPVQASLHSRQGTIGDVRDTQPETYQAVSRQIAVFKRQVVWEDTPGQLQEQEHIAVERQVAIPQQQALMGMSPYEHPLALEAYGQMYHHQLCMSGTAGRRTGALRPSEYHAIRKNYANLVSDMPANQVVDFMFAGGIVNSEQMNKMTSMSAEEKARIILDSVLRHPRGYATLIEALESDQCSADWLAEQLRNVMEEFEKMSTDESTL